MNDNGQTIDKRDHTIVMRFKEFVVNSAFQSHTYKYLKSFAHKKIVFDRINPNLPQTDGIF